jgi:hypothetical protein
MSNPEPLHVKTAAAIGWKDLSQDPDGKWWGVEPHGGLRMTVPRYDSSWCSAGPLCERFKIGVLWDLSGWVASFTAQDGRDQYAGGSKPAEAISLLVVHLGEKGMLMEKE